MKKKFLFFLCIIVFLKNSIGSENCTSSSEEDCLDSSSSTLSEMNVYDELSSLQGQIDLIRREQIDREYSRDSEIFQRLSNIEEYLEHLNGRIEGIQDKCFKSKTVENLFSHDDSFRSRSAPPNL